MDFTEADILEALSSDPAEFVDMVLRVDLMLTIGDYFRERNTSHEQISEILEISPPWVNQLIELNVDMFSTEELKGYCDKVGIPFESLLDQVQFN